MKITNFEHTGLDKVVSWAKTNRIKALDESSLKKALSTCNIFFIAEGINRVQSTLLCELKDSYVQQSQRYVTMQTDSYFLPELDGKDENSAKELVEKAFSLYQSMSKLKNGEIKGRPKPGNYIHSIPIEDARYILPLSTKTNLSIALTGNKLYDMYCLLNDLRYQGIFEDFKKELSVFLPIDLINLLPKEYSVVNIDLIDNLYQYDLNLITNENNPVLINGFKNLDLRAGLGAMTSTQSRTASETMEQWGDEAVSKAKDVARRVLGYGHESIAEQARTTFGLMCSLAAYHQQIRHRLPESYREELKNLILNKDRPVLVPPSIKNSAFYQEFLDLASDFKEFRFYLYSKYDSGEAFSFLLNCDQIKMIISTNARMDTGMLAERTCMNAQWEIRELAIKKLKILRDLSDVLYEKALPSCITSRCKEGKLTCGQAQEVRRMFAKPDHLV